MHVGLLGPLEVVADGQAVEIGGARLRTLLVRLALDAGRTVSTDALARALWPDHIPADPANALQSLVSRLRRALPDHDAVRSEPHGYRLDLPPHAVDAALFEHRVRDGRHALRDGDPDEAARVLRQALDLWRGDALADVADASFAAAPAARLAELRLAATEDHLDAELRRGHEPAPLVAELEALTAAHPLRERLRALLVKALHAAGRQAEALTAYEDYRQLLADELGSDPGPNLQQAHLAALRDDYPGPPRRGNLRATLTSFVGRDDERARIVERFRQGRLVTVVGPGGTGKTRLAGTVAADLNDHVHGGAWLVELAALNDPTDPDSLAEAVIGALGLRDVSLPDAPAPPDATRRLVDALTHSDALIVLDNCEHVVDAAGRLAGTLLARCPRLRILATSREPLGVAGEALCPVDPLGLPEPGASAAEALASPAIQLFADRAGAVRPGFQVTDANVADVAEICRRLDGLPLAIELATARLRSFTVDQIASRLDDRFRLLDSGRRVADPRHQTLRAVVDWSWNLLDDDEQLLAARVAVFPAGITLDAAERVGGPVPDVPQRVAALVDKSLLQLTEEPGPRYRMLETVREYALEWLAGTGELAEARAAHAAYAADLAEEVEPHLRGSGQVGAIRRLSAERDNLHAALRFAADAGEAALATRLGAALGLFWTIQGNHADAAGRLRLALDTRGAAPPDRTVVATVFYLLNTYLAGNYDRAQAARARSLLPQAPHLPAATLLEPVIALAVGDRDVGVRAVDQLLPGPDRWTQAMLILVRALLHGGHGDMANMCRDLADAAGAFRAAGERWGLAHTLTYLAYGQTTAGDVDDAAAGLEEAIGLLRELDPADDLVLQRVLLATARARQGAVDQARADLAELVAPASGRSWTSSRVFAHITLGDLARHDGDLESAEREYGAATDDLGRGTHDAPAFRAMLAAATAELAIARGQLDTARRHLTEGLAVAADAADPPIEGLVGVAVAHLRVAQGAVREAAMLLGSAHALRGGSDDFDPDVARLVAQLHRELGEPAYRAAHDRGRALDRPGALAMLEAELDLAATATATS